MPRRPPPEHSRWKKGQSGNPAGPKPGRSARLITDYILDILAEEGRDGRSNSELIAARVIRDAIAGKPHALTHIADRTEGKAPSRVELTGADGGPVLVAGAREALMARLRRGKGGARDGDPQ